MRREEGAFQKASILLRPLRRIEMMGQRQVFCDGGQIRVGGAMFKERRFVCNRQKLILDALQSIEFIKKFAKKRADVAMLDRERCDRF